MVFEPQTSLLAGPNAAALRDAVVLPWFKACEQTLGRHNEPAALLVPSQAVGAAVKRMVLEAGIGIFNVHVLTPGQLRERLSAAAGLDAPIAVREDLRLLLSHTAEGLVAEYPEAAIVAQQPDELLRAWDALSAAGYSEQAIESPVHLEILRGAKELKQAAGLETVYDRNKALKPLKPDVPQFSHLLIYGFGAEEMEHFPLLQAGIRASRFSMVCHSTGNQSQMESIWTGQWEEAYGSFEYVEESGDLPRFAPLGELIAEGKSLPEPPEGLKFRAFSNLRIEARAAVAQAVAFTEESGSGPVGIVVPRLSSLAREVSSELTRLNIPHHDMRGTYAGANLQQQTLLAWAQWQETPQITTYLEFLKKLVLLYPGQLQAAMHLNKAIDQAFGLLCVDDWEPIAYLCRQYVESKPEALKLLGEWTLLPKSNSLSGYIAAVSGLLEALELKAQWNEGEHYTRPLQSVLSNGLSRRHFVGWFRERMRTPGKTRQTPGRAVFSAIQVVDYASAAYIPFSHAIFTGLNQEGWPGEGHENHFLPDSRIQHLNEAAVMTGSQGEGHWIASPGYVLSSEHRRVLADSAWLNLLEQVSGELVLTLTLDPTSEKSAACVPGDLFLKTWLAVRGSLPTEGDLSRLRKMGDYFAQSAGTGETELAFPERDACVEIWKRRRDATMPYDAYSFGYDEPPAHGLSLPAKSWEGAVLNPERTWFQKILKISPAENYSVLRSSPLVTGTWLHDWLKLPNESKDAFLPCECILKTWPALVSEHARIKLSEAEAVFAGSGRMLPDWWQYQWSEIHDKALLIAEKLEHVEGWEQVASEWNLPTGTKIYYDDASEALNLSGRMDCVFKGTGMNRTWVIDFKTGSTELPKNEKKQKDGVALQLVLYGLALSDLFGGAAQASILHPDEELNTGLTLPEDLTPGFLELWKGLIELQHCGILGQKAPAFGSDDALPIATLPIDKEILSAKRALTYPTFPQ
ncbi:MAG: PD-(D/E)XK nuclease family protein [Opitutales bacterium]|nr:PD-(D/E)XK nuclease family protein [Opitutales bacterium]